MIDFIFTILALLTVSSSIYLVTSKNLVRSAVALFFTLFGLAGFYIMLYADFVAGAQILIYVGGILVLIIFGVMLTNRIDESSIASSSQNQFIGGLASLAIFVMLIGIIYNTPWHAGNMQSREETVSLIGKLILNEYLLPFEIVSILLLGALIGAALLSSRISFK